MYPDEELVLNSVRRLIKLITGREEDEVRRDWVESATLLLCVPDCPIPDRRSLQQGMSSLALKFHVHGFFGLSTALEKAMEDLLESRDLQEYDRDVPWNVLTLLRELSVKPMDHAHEAAVANQALVDGDADQSEEAFDWAAYLKEDRPLDHVSDEDSSDWSQLTDEEEPAPAPDRLRVLFESGGRRSVPRPLGRNTLRKSRAVEELRTSQLDQDSDQWSQLSDEDEFGDEPLDIRQPRPARHMSAGHFPSTPGSDDDDRSAASSSLPGMIRAPRGASLVQPYSDNPFVMSTNFIVTTFPSEISIQQSLGTSSEQSGLNIEAEMKEEEELNKEELAAYAAAFEAEEIVNDLTLGPDWFAEEKMAALPGPPTDRIGALHFTTQGVHRGTTVLSEYQVLRDVLWTLLAPAESRCFGRDLRGRYRPRPDFTIVNVSVISLWTYLSTEYCCYFDMALDMDLFRRDVNGGADEPPATYAAYCGALEPYVNRLKHAVQNVLDATARQDDVNTLISVKHKLKPKLDDFEYIVKLHRKATCAWRNEDNWYSAIRLLAVLYQEICESSVQERILIALDLFLRSFHPYVKIMDYWLTQDECIDYRNEFIIYRGSNMDSSMRDTWHEGMFTRPWREQLRDVAPPPSIIAQVENRVLLGCKSVYILRAMKQLTQEHRQAGLLYADFLSDLSDNFSRFSAAPNDSGFTSEADPDVTPPPPSEIVAATRGAASSSASAQNEPANVFESDPFLRAALKEFERPESRDEEQSIEYVVDDSCSRVLSRWREALPTQHAATRTFRALVDDKYRALGSRINAVLRDEMDIGRHLAALRATFLIATGDVTALFFQQIDQKVKDEPCWLYAHYLTSDLRDHHALAGLAPQPARFRVMVDDRFLHRDVMRAIDGIQILYAVDWPLSLIVTPNLPLYNDIFRLLLKLKWSLTSLQRLRFDQQLRRGQAAACARRIARWQTLRFWVMNAVAGAHRFTMSHVIHAFAPQLDHIIRHGQDFDQLITAHLEYLQTVYQLCVNPFEGSELKPHFDHLLTLAQCIVDFWAKSNHPSTDAKLQKMEMLYCQLHTSIGIELADFLPSDDRISTESLLSVFYYPLKPLIGLQNSEIE